MISLNTIIKYYLLSIGISLLYFIIFTKSNECEDSKIDTIMSLPFVPFVMIRETFKIRFYFFDIIIEFRFKILKIFHSIVVRTFYFLVKMLNLLGGIVKSLDSLLEYIFLNFIQPILSCVFKKLGFVINCFVFLIKYIIKVFLNIFYKFTFIFDCIYILVKLIFKKLSLAFNVCYFYVKTFFCMICNCIYQVYLNLYPYIERVSLAFNVCYFYAKTFFFMICDCIYQVYLNLYPYIERTFNVIYIRVLNVYQRLVRIFS